MGRSEVARGRGAEEAEETPVGSTSARNPRARSRRRTRVARSRGLLRMSEPTPPDICRGLTRHTVVEYKGVPPRGSRAQGCLLAPEFVQAGTRIGSLRLPALRPRTPRGPGGTGWKRGGSVARGAHGACRGRAGPTPRQGARGRPLALQTPGESGSGSPRGSARERRTRTNPTRMATAAAREHQRRSSVTM